MTTFFLLLPVYLFGNLHCLGMCGPLVMLLGKHRYKMLYFLGRLVSFSLAGGLAGAAGAVLHLFLQQYHLSSLLSIGFGLMIASLGIMSFFRLALPLPQFLHKTQQLLTPLILRDHPLPTFLFGFFTVLLPCGQTLIVFSACALSGSGPVGLFNGFMFALLTSPSLFFAMQAHSLLSRLKKHYNTFMGVSAIVIGLIACLRGLADMQVISHMILNPDAEIAYHIVLY
jgi:uncharacterized protein